MGVDLDNPEVKKLLEMFEKERDLEELQKQLGDIPWWRRILARALDKNKILNFQNFCYLLIVLNMLYKMRSMYKSVCAAPTCDHAGRIHAIAHSGDAVLTLPLILPLALVLTVSREDMS